MVEKEEGGPGGISEEEAAQYDRQIRLWGLEAQKRSVGLGTRGGAGGGPWRGLLGALRPVRGPEGACGGPIGAWRGLVNVRSGF